MKILEIFGENRLQFVGKCKIINMWRMNSIEKVKVSNVPAKLCAFGPKPKKIWKNFQENFEIF